MGTFKTRGIVLKETISGESDKRLILLVKGRGKISVSAKGARNQKSKFMAGTGLFCYSDLVIFEGGGFLSLSQCELIEPFYLLRNDITRLSYASYFLELTDKMSPAGVNCDDALLLLLKTLLELSKGKQPPSLIARIFEFKFLDLEGFCPKNQSCAYCRENISDNFYFGRYGLICEKCIKQEKGAISISHASLYTLNHILSSDLNSLFSFTVSDGILSQLKSMSKKLIAEQLEFNLKTYEFVQEIENL